MSLSFSKSYNCLIYECISHLFNKMYSWINCTTIFVNDSNLKGKKISQTLILATFYL